MVICKNCNRETHYNNRFYNKCQECGETITHTCWKCGIEINPKECIESPFTHYHKCPNCGSWGQDEKIEEVEKCILDSIQYITDGDWGKVFCANDIPKAIQLVMMLKGEQGRKYFCPKGISTGKPKTAFRKFKKMLDIGEKEYTDLFTRVFLFIKEKEINETFYANQIGESILTNTENIVLVDYFVCMGMIEKMSLNPAKYKIISHETKMCNYFSDIIKYKCLKCGTIQIFDSKGEHRCDCYKQIKGKEKGLGLKMSLQNNNTICSCTEKIMHYWDNKKGDDVDNNE